MIDSLSFVATLASFYASILIAQLISHHKSFSFLSDRQGRYGTLDGLRGFLFLSKITQTNGKIKWLYLYESRIFRIVPLYILAVVIISFAAFSNTNFELQVSLLELLREFFSWSSFHGDIINNYPETRRVIAGVDWTLKYEWVFYFSLPLLASILFRLGKWGGLFLLCASALLFFKLIRITSFSSYFNSSFFIFFAVGGFSVFVNQKIQFTDSFIKSKFVSSITALAILLALFYPRTFSPIHAAIISLIFILVVLGNDLFGIFSLRSSILLGKISYSIYLLHGAILYFAFTYFEIIDFNNYSLQEYLVFMPIVSAIAVLVSILTFLLIEKPSIRQGRQYYFSNKFYPTQTRPSKQIRAK